VSEDAERAAWRELEALVDVAVWRYAEAETARARAEIEAGWPPLAARQLDLARLAAARRLRAVAAAIERDAVRGALAEDVTYAALAVRPSMCSLCLTSYLLVGHGGQQSASNRS
jgi:hypothetical protein